MTGQKDIKKFLFPYTPSQDLIWAKFEKITPIQVKGAFFLTIFLFSLEGKFGGNYADTK